MWKVYQAMIHPEVQHDSESSPKICCLIAHTPHLLLHLFKNLLGLNRTTTVEREIPRGNLCCYTVKHYGCSNNYLGHMVIYMMTVSEQT